MKLWILIKLMAPLKRQSGYSGFQIEDLLHEGQSIMVQVSKEPLGNKGARLTSHVSLPGRHLVLMPTVNHIGVSRKIEDREERERLKGIIRDINPDPLVSLSGR